MGTQVLNIDLRVTGLEEGLAADALGEAAEEVRRLVASRAATPLDMSADELLERGIVGIAQGNGGLTVYGNEGNLGVDRFDPVQTPEGVRFTHPARGEELIEDAFVVDSLGGGVFKRTGEPSPEDPSREQIEQQEVALGGDFWAKVEDELSPEDIGRVYAESLEEALGG